MTEYNHAYSLGFSLEGSFDEKGEDVTEEMLRSALIKRIEELDKEGEGSHAFANACDCPWDSYVVEKMKEQENDSP